MNVIKKYLIAFVRATLKDGVLVFCPPIRISSDRGLSSYTIQVIAAPNACNFFTRSLT